MRILRWFFHKIPITLGYLVMTALLSGVIFLAYICYYIYYNRQNLPDITPFVQFDPPVTGEIYDLNGKVIIGLAKEYRRINKYSDIPEVVREAILSAEDKRFFRHKGIDGWAILEAAVYSGVDSLSVSAKLWEKGNYTFRTVYSHGGSTLDQQIIKLYFQKEKTDTLWKKIEKMRLAVYLNEEMKKRYGIKAKEEIFARFASFIYLGVGRYGFDAGAEYFYGKRIGDFGKNDIDKAAFLAGLVRHPFPSRNAPTEKYFNRRNEVLKQMFENEYISEDEFKELSKRELVLLAKANSKTIAPSTVGNTFDEINQVGFSDTQFFEGRVSVFSTIDLRIQEIANQALENGLLAYEERYPKSKEVIQGSVVVLRNSDGAILAEVGGRKVFNSRKIAYTDFNRVRHSRRQPGSAFKPFVYLTAIKEGWTLESIIQDAPVAVPMGSIKVGNKWVKRPPKWIANYDGKFKGFIPLRKALAESRNAPTIRLAGIVGIKDVIQTAHLIGIKTKLESYITTAIGASDVNLLELANAYRAMASGIYAEPYSVVKLTDRNGGVIYTAKDKTKVLEIDKAVLEQIQEGMRGVVRIPGGTAHSLDNNDFPIPIMGKTGTTNDFRDALFVGSTYGIYGITVAVRVGYDDNQELGSKETGGRTALPVFKEIMLNVYRENLVGPVPEFPEEIENNISDYLQGSQ